MTTAATLSTLIDKLGQLQHDTGGFGGLLVMIYDFSTEQGAWENHSTVW